QSICSYINTRSVLVNPFARRGALVTHCDNFGSGYTLQIPYHIGSPITVPYYAELDRANCFPGYHSWGHRCVRVYHNARIGRHLITPSSLKSSLMSSLKDSSWSTQQDFYIQPRRPCSGVNQIETHHLVKFDTIATVHLPESSDPRLCFQQPSPVPQIVSGNLVRKRRTRPNQ